MLDPARANLEDGYRERGARRRLVDTLRAKGIRNEQVLAAIGAVPRHAFFERAFAEHAYQDKAFPIGLGQTISQPYTVARQTELIEPAPGQRVLEIGTGSGYQCAVLCRMGLEVYTIEYVPELSVRARHLLARLGLSPAGALAGDGTGGWPAKAPFDAILVTAGAPAVPETLARQLKTGGRLVVPVGTSAEQRMLRLIRQADGTLTREDTGGFRFVPLKGREGWQ